MGKTIIVKYKALSDKDDKEKRFCKNCGTQLLKKLSIGEFCCKGCKEEYFMKWHPQSRQILDPTQLPYQSYAIIEE